VVTTRARPGLGRNLLPYHTFTVLRPVRRAAMTIPIYRRSSPEHRALHVLSPGVR
jgi:hypothetical protein